MRNTIQRLLVLEAVRSLHNHATADEIYALIAKDHPSVSKGTVYRNLTALADSGEIRRLQLSGNPDRFDHLTGPHYHARCSQCGKLFDLEMDYDPQLETRIKDTQGFKIDGHELLFWGVCGECQEKGLGTGD